MKNPATLRQERAALLEQMRDILTEADTEERAMSEDEESRYADLESKIEALTEDIDRREKLDGMTADAPPVQTRAPVHHRRPTPDTPEGIFCRYVRSGDEGAERELRASNDTTMNITTAADGGNLVPTGHYRGIIERARPLALPILLNVQNIPGKGTTVNVPVDNEADSGVFVSTSESSGFDRDAPAVNKIAMTLVKYTKKVDLTYELLEDEDSRLLAFLENYVGSGYAATLNNLMIVEALADGTAALTLDANTTIAAAEVPELFYKLSAEYARGGSLAWVMARATEGVLAGLTSANRFLFAPTPGGMAEGTTWGRLWGVPLYTDSNMGAITASGKSMIIANWGYMGMRLEPAMTFLRDPYTRSSYGEIILNYYFRADFEVLQAGAFQYATHPT